MSAILDTPPPGPPGPVPAAPAAPAESATPAEPAAPARRRRPRLVHVDAMRPIKQLGVVSTHSLQNFAPQASLGVGASLMLTHVTRFAFMFISAAMLVYAYPVVAQGGWRTFWRRRLLAVVLPYVTWTIVYFALGLAQNGIGDSTKDVGHFFWMLLSGYDQLYFLVVLLQFYLIYPAFLWLLRRTERHHWWLLGASLAVEVALLTVEHWNLVPFWMLNQSATRELWNYQLFVLAGGVMAWHYQDVHNWLVRHWRGLLVAMVVAVGFSEGWYLLAVHHVPGFRTGNASDPFQPVEIPLYLGLITAIYLLGVLLARDSNPRWLRRLVQAGADYSYGVYLSQVLFLTALVTFGWPSLQHVLPWPVVTLGGIVIIYAAATALTWLLARLPGSRATAGIPRKPWRRPALAVAPAPAPAPAPTEALSQLSQPPESNVPTGTPVTSLPL